jgi:uncharacterized oligopeptide transporter (OPT) family protein
MSNEGTKALLFFFYLGMGTYAGVVQNIVLLIWCIIVIFLLAFSTRTDDDVDDKDFYKKFLEDHDEWMRKIDKKKEVK